MLSKLYRFSARISIIIVSFVISTCLFIILARIDKVIAGSGGMGVLYLQLSFLKQYFVPVVATWGNRGIDIFLQTIWLDFILPPAYAVLLASFYAYLNAGSDGDQKKIIRKDLIHFTLPFIAALCDCLENTAHIVILSYRWFFDSLILAGSVMALIKWAIAAYMVFVIIMQYLRGMRRNAQDTIT